jgi:hypothetical protein
MAFPITPPAGWNRHSMLEWLNSMLGGVTSEVQAQLDAAQVQIDANALAAAIRPYFWAYNLASDTGQDYSTAKVYTGLDTVLVDTNSNFSLSKRFTPTVAGWYYFKGSIRLSAWTLTAGTTNYLGIRKNATISNGTYHRGYPSYGVVNATGGSITADGVLEMNGSGDYVELFLGIATDTSVSITGGAGITYFQGYRLGDI